MTVITKLLGFMLSRLHKCRTKYESNRISSLLGGKDRIIQYPYQISGINNLIVGPSVNIGQGAIIMTTRAKIVIKGHFVSGPGLTLITGDHMPIIGKFIDEVSDSDKDRIDIEGKYDQNMIIEEDVWAGANVTILKGVTIGRGSIIAAGSVVTRDIPPYCIAAGIPAKPIKRRLSLDQIAEHEEHLYPQENRINLHRNKEENL